MHVKLNRVLKIIPRHPCWCRQKSRTVCAHNVQLMPTFFSEMYDIISETYEDTAIGKWQTRRFQ